MRRNMLLLTLCLLMLSPQAAIAKGKWSFLAPGSGDPNVYRAFAFAKDNDDRLEIACNKKRIDFFYSASKTFSQSDLKKIKSSEPKILIRFKYGLGSIRPDTVKQEGDRLLFITDVKPKLLTDMADIRTSFVAGIRMSGKILSQGLFPRDGLQRAVRGLAAGCGF